MNSEALCMGRKQRTSKRNDAIYFNDRKYLRYKIKINHRVVIDYNLLTAHATSQLQYQPASPHGLRYVIMYSY